MLGAMVNILFGINAADNEALRQRLAANQQYAEAQNRKYIQDTIREVQASVDAQKGIIEGTFTVVEEPKLLEGK